MVNVLDAIRHDRTLPPIEVVEAISNYIATGSTMAATGWPPPSPLAFP
jgi:hypothetical protein